MSAVVEQQQAVFTGMEAPHGGSASEAAVDKVSLTTLVASLEVSKDAGSAAVPCNNVPCTDAPSGEVGGGGSGDERTAAPKQGAGRSQTQRASKPSSLDGEVRNNNRPSRSSRHSHVVNSSGAGVWPAAAGGHQLSGAAYPPNHPMNLYAMYPLPYAPTASPAGGPPFFSMPPQAGPMQSLDIGSPPHLPTMFPAFPGGSFGPGPGYLFGSSPPAAVLPETMPGSNHAWGPQQHYIPHQHPPPPPPLGMHYGGTAAPPPPPRRSYSSSIISGSSSGSLSAAADLSTNSDSTTVASPSGKPPCAFFMKTGTCAYGDKCKFDHPPGRQPPRLNSLGFPMRPNEADCVYFMKKGTCGFGITCKFNHPEVSVPGWPRASPAPSPAPSMIPASPMLMYPGMMGQPVMPVMPFPASQPLPNPMTAAVAATTPPTVVLPSSPTHIPACSGWNGTQPPPPPPFAHSPSSHSTASDTTHAQQQPLPRATSHGSPTAHLQEMLGISPSGASDLKSEGDSGASDSKQVDHRAQVSEKLNEMREAEKGVKITSAMPPADAASCPAPPQSGLVVSVESVTPGPPCVSHVPTTHCTTVTAS